MGTEQRNALLGGPAQSRRAQWSLGRVVVVGLIGLAAGILFSPALIQSVSRMRSGMPFSDILLVSAFANVLMLPSFLGAALVRRFGACLLAQAGMALALAVLTPYGLDVLLSCFLLGVFTESAVAFSTRYRHFTTRRMSAAGIAVALPSFALNIVGHGLVLAPAELVLLIAATFGTAIAVALASTLLGQRCAAR